MKRLRSFYQVYIYVSLVLVAYLYWEVLHRYPENHVSWEPLNLWIIPILTAGMLAAPWAEKRVWSWLHPFIWVSGCCLMVIMFQYDLLVQYDDWLRRGMPRPGI